MEFESKNLLILGGFFILCYIFFVHFKKKQQSRAANKEAELAPLSSDYDKFDELKSLLASPVCEGWDVVKDVPGLQVYKKIPENSPVAIIKAKIIIKDTTQEDVLFAIWDGKFRREWDNVIQNFHVIEQESEDSDIIYFYAASPMPSIVSNREFIQHRKFVRENSGIFIVYWSAEREDIPIPDGWVRANTIISGYAIKKVQDGVMVEFISQNDVKGKIPPKLINAVAPSKAMDWVKKLGKACIILKQKKR